MIPTTPYLGKMGAKDSRFIPALCNWLGKSLTKKFLQCTIGERIYMRIMRKLSLRNMHKISRDIAEELDNFMPDVWGECHVTLTSTRYVALRRIAFYIRQYARDARSTSDLCTYIHTQLRYAQEYTRVGCYEPFFDVIESHTLILFTRSIFASLYDGEALDCARILEYILHEHIRYLQKLKERGLEDGKEIERIHTFLPRVQVFIHERRQKLIAYVYPLLEEAMQGNLYDTHIRDVIAAYI